MKIQADIPKELNQHLKMHKVRNDLVSLEEALIDVLCEFFKQPKEVFLKK
jgi:hypothetical protein